MRELNAKVDLQHEDPADVANAYLKSKGLMD
jgi:glycine betaine/choline ABC-type transport system substrate-binding protein